MTVLRANPIGSCVDRKGATQDFNALRDLLDSPSKHLWITFEGGCMWWCTVLDGATANPDGESRMIFAFHSPDGQLAPRDDIPGVQVWTGDLVAQLAVQLSLGEWIEAGSRTNPF